MPGQIAIPFLFEAWKDLGQSNAQARARKEAREARKAALRSAVVGTALGVGAIYNPATAPYAPFIAMGTQQLAQGAQDQPMDPGTIPQIALGAGATHQKQKGVQQRRQQVDLASQQEAARRAAIADFQAQQQQEQIPPGQEYVARQSMPFVGQAPPPAAGGVPFLDLAGEAAKGAYVQQGDYRGLVDIATLAARGMGGGATEPYTTITTDEGIFQYNQATGEKGPRLGAAQAKGGAAGGTGKTVIVGDKVKQFNPKSGLYDIEVGDAPERGKGAGKETLVDIRDRVTGLWTIGVPQDDALEARKEFDGEKVEIHPAGTAEKQSKSGTLYDIVSTDEQGRPTGAIANAVSLEDGLAIQSQKGGRLVPFGTAPPSEPRPPQGSQDQRDFEILNDERRNRGSVDPLTYGAAYMRLAQPRMIMDAATGQLVPTGGHDLSKYPTPEGGVPELYTQRGLPPLTEGRREPSRDDAKLMSGISKALPSLQEINKSLGTVGRVKGLYSMALAWAGVSDEAIALKSNRQQMIVAAQDIIKGIPSNWDVQNYEKLQIDLTDPPAVAKAKMTILMRNLAIDSLNTIVEAGTHGVAVPQTWYSIATEIMGTPIKNVDDALREYNKIIGGKSGGTGTKSAAKDLYKEFNLER